MQRNVPSGTPHRVTSSKNVSERFLQLFYLLCFFDSFFTFVLWIIVGKTSPSGDSLLDFFKNSVSNYSFDKSLFDVVMISAGRNFILVVAFAILHFRHSWIVGLSTLASTAFLIAKAFYFDFDSTIPTEYIFLPTSFLIPWMQAWMWAARAWSTNTSDNERLLNTQSTSHGNGNYGSTSTSANYRSAYGTPAYMTKYGNGEQPQDNNSTYANRSENVNPDVNSFNFLPANGQRQEKSILNLRDNVNSYGNAGHGVDIYSNGLQSGMDSNSENTPFGTPPEFDDATSESNPLISGSGSADSIAINSVLQIELLEFVRLAENALDLTWAYGTLGDGWTLVSDKNDMQVYSKKTNSMKIFKSVTVINLSPFELFELLHVDIADQKSWNKNVHEYKVLETINETTDITYALTNEAAGGVVSPRDFINVRQWRKTGNSFLSAGIGIEYSNYPPNPNIIRGYNGPGGFLILEVPGRPSQCCFVWVMNTDLKGWLPRSIVDSTMSGALIDFSLALRQRAIPYKQEIQGRVLFGSSL